ncbi:hypothetical protein J4227_07200 [Candidatus Woesearchaeota archaeon]|nr:hypothetical protein [Candidatus Woesearchaeota archaeon]
MVEESPIQKLEKALIGSANGMTIQQIIDISGLARGTVKTYLEELKRMGRVHEQEYGSNTKVFFLNGKGEFQQNVQMHSGVLFIDVLTDPWKQPFIRVKYRNKQKDVGAIFLNAEDSVDKLINALQKAKPQLKRYKELISKLDAATESG